MNTNILKVTKRSPGLKMLAHASPALAAEAGERSFTVHVPYMAWGVECKHTAPDYQAHMGGRSLWNTHVRPQSSNLPTGRGHQRLPATPKCPELVQMQTRSEQRPRFSAPHTAKAGHLLSSVSCLGKLSNHFWWNIPL